ncbi:MAG: leucine-rich repeat domain-containing protein [Spirochaetaceae bacterium]|jgi:hypothetical protein|nr:leucine-rich repeat domain-containing protein [Spirochaetaceae bacterium]
MKKFVFILIGIGLSALLWGQAVTDPSFVDGRRTFIGAPLGTVAQQQPSGTQVTAQAQGALANHLNAQGQAEEQGVNLRDTTAQGVLRRLQFLEYLHGLTGAAPAGPVQGFIPAQFGTDQVIIIGYEGPQLKGEIQIPSTLDVNGIAGTVVGIGDSALSNLKIDGKIIIPNTVTFIGVEAFANNIINGVEIPESVTEIRNSAFTNNKLANVTIPTSISTITYGTFSNNVLTSVTIPSTVTLIEHHAFATNLLAALNIPTSVTQIDNSAFENNRLAALTIPDSIEAIGDNAFATNRLTSIRISRNQGLTKLNYGVFSHNLLPTVEIPANITEIGDNAFTDNRMKQVTIPQQVVSIGKGSFSVNALEKVNFTGDETIQRTGYSGQVQGASVTSIGDGAFSINRLTQISIPDTVTIIGSQAFYANHISRVNFGVGVEKIGSYAFQQNNLIGVTIPDSVIEIGEGSFIGAQPNVQPQALLKDQGPTQVYQNKLTQVALGNTLETIGIAAFGYNQIDSITIPNSVQEIRREAFTNNLIAGLSLGTSVQIIGDRAFNVNQITTVRIPETCTALGVGAFTNNKINQPVIIPRGVIGNSANMQNVLNTQGRRDAIQRAFDNKPAEFILIFL